jgi:DNA-binding XRE family transcriptional regulator
LAAKAGLVVRTVRALKRGRGRLDSWNAAVGALGLVLSGRNLPGGTTTGGRVAMLRHRRGLSQEELARSVGVTKPTIGAVEGEGRGRFLTFQAVLRVHGAGAYLAPRDGTAAFFTYAGNASVDHRWETPAELLEALHRVFGA